MKYDRICPNCNAINPPIERFNHMHFGSQCKNIVGFKKVLFWTKPIYCDSVNELDEDDDWIYTPVNK